MEASLHFRGVRIPSYHSGTARLSHSPRMRWLSSVASPSRSFYAAVENACKGGGFRAKSDGKRIEAALEEEEEEKQSHGCDDEAAAAAAFTCVMKFGGSSLASAERIREIAQLVVSFPEETPLVVLSAMGKTTNNLLLVMHSSLSSN